MIQSGYTKLFGSIVASTIWREDDKTRIVWITLLALSDKNGYVAGSVPGLADLARVCITDCEQALEKLRQPDKYSRSPEHDGRRIEVVDGGWLILNRAKYRDGGWEEEKAERHRRANKRWYENKKKKSDQDSDTSDIRTSESDCIGDKKEKEKEKEYISSNSLSESTLTLSNPDGFDATLNEIFHYYREKTDRNVKTYEFTPSRRKKGTTRFRECLRKTGGNLEKAKMLMQLAIDGLAASDWHMGRDAKTNGKRYCEWEENLFKSYEQMERWWNHVSGALPAKPSGHGAEVYS